ncbi:hypothetical protein Q5752_006980 [Cryptotrichosporon argae]
MRSRCTEPKTGDLRSDEAKLSARVIELVARRGELLSAIARLEAREAGFAHEIAGARATLEALELEVEEKAAERGLYDALAGHEYGDAGRAVRKAHFDGINKGVEEGRREGETALVKERTRVEEERRVCQGLRETIGVLEERIRAAAGEGEEELEEVQRRAVRDRDDLSGQVKREKERRRQADRERDEARAELDSVRRRLEESLGQTMDEAERRNSFTILLPLPQNVPTTPKRTPTKRPAPAQTPPPPTPTSLAARFAALERAHAALRADRDALAAKSARDHEYWASYKAAEESRRAEKRKRREDKAHRANTTGGQPLEPLAGPGNVAAAVSAEGQQGDAQRTRAEAAASDEAEHARKRSQTHSPGRPITPMPDIDVADANGRSSTASPGGRVVGTARALPHPSDITRRSLEVSSDPVVEFFGTQHSRSSRKPNDGVSRPTLISRRAATTITAGSVHAARPATISGAPSGSVAPPAPDGAPTRTAPLTAVKPVTRVAAMSSVAQAAKPSASTDSTPVRPPTISDSRRLVASTSRVTPWLGSAIRPRGATSSSRRPNATSAIDADFDTDVEDDAIASPTVEQRRLVRDRGDLRKAAMGKTGLGSTTESAWQSATASTSLDNSSTITPSIAVKTAPSPMADGRSRTLKRDRSLLDFEGLSSAEKAKRKKELMRMPEVERKKLYAAYKGKGRYTAPEDLLPNVLDEYEIDPAKNDGARHQFHEVRRGRAERRQMHGTDCECCRDYYEAVGAVPRFNVAPRWRDNDEGDDGAEDHREGLVDHRNRVSRHREVWQKPPTPPEFWQIGFPTTQDVQAINAEADEMNRKREAQIRHEAAHKDSKWRRRE